MRFVRDAPFDIVVLHLHPIFSHGFRHSLEFLYTLVVIVDKDSGNTLMTRLNQLANQLIRAFLIVDDDPGEAEVFIIIVIKDHRNPAAVQFLVAVQIGVHDAGLNTVHNEALKILMHHGLKALAFIGELVVCQENMQVYPMVCQHTADAIDQHRVRIRILTLENQADFPFRILIAQIPGYSPILMKIGAAALNPVNQTFLYHLIHCHPDCFPADTQPAAKGIFRRQLLVSGKLILIDVCQQPAVYLLGLAVGNSHGFLSPL